MARCIFPVRQDQWYKEDTARVIFEAIISLGELIRDLDMTKAEDRNIIDEYLVVEIARLAYNPSPRLGLIRLASWRALGLLLPAANGNARRLVEETLRIDGLTHPDSEVRQTVHELFKQNYRHL